VRVGGDLGRHGVVLVPGPRRFDLVAVQQFGVVEQDVDVPVIGQAVALAAEQGVRVIDRRQVTGHVDLVLVGVDPRGEVGERAGVDEIAKTEVEVIEDVEFACAALHVEDLLAGQLVVRRGGHVEIAARSRLPRRRKHVAERRDVRLVHQQLERDAVESA
jgi:hypothetical protein